MNLKLENQVVIITGATGGIGGEIVAEFLREKAIVVCLIRNELKMEKFKILSVLLLNHYLIK